MGKPEAMKWETLLNKERPRKSTNPGDHRTEFERDFDRTVFSTPVKRLQDKAQVFPLEPHDAVRTRLTHSLEVSSVARGLGMRVAKWLIDEDKIDTGMDRWIEAIAETCGLIHDLGNPPFGHAGEGAIRYWFERQLDKIGCLDDLCEEQFVNDFILFDGNAQTLRLVSKLQILVDFNGLNLTYGTLSALCKYLPASHQIMKDSHAFSKPGYFASEQGIVDKIRSKTGTGNARNPITLLVEAADDIVYSVADVEDGVKKGIISWSSIRKKIRQGNKSANLEALKRMKTILSAGSEQNPRGIAGDVYASAFRTAAIGVLVNSVFESFKENYLDIMKGCYCKELVEDCKAFSLIKKLKYIGGKYIYCTPSTLKLELMGRKVICDLMDLFWEGAKSLPLGKQPSTKLFPGKAGALLSENYREVFNHEVNTYSHLPPTYHRYRLVTDYVCGMTDSFAKRLHAELNNGA